MPMFMLLSCKLVQMFCPGDVQGYDATAAAQQGYNAGAAPTQQQGYGQPAASVGLGVDQQSKLAQIIAQASAASP